MPELLKAIKAFKKSKYVKALPGVSNNMDKAHDLVDRFEEAVAAASSAEDLSPEQERAMAAWEKEAADRVYNAETNLNNAREALKNEPPFPSANNPANNLAKERWKEGTKVRVSNAQSELKAAKDTQRNGPPFSARKVAAEAKEKLEKNLEMLEHLLIGLREDSRDIKDRKDMKDEARPLLEKVISELEAIMRPS